MHEQLIRARRRRTHGRVLSYNTMGTARIHHGPAQQDRSYRQNERYLAGQLRNLNFCGCLAVGVCTIDKDGVYMAYYQLSRPPVNKLPCPGVKARPLTFRGRKPTCRRVTPDSYSKLGMTRPNVIEAPTHVTQRLYVPNNQYGWITRELVYTRENDTTTNAGLKCSSVRLTRCTIGYRLF